MTRVAIVGAGQSGAQPALGPLNNGHEVTLVTDDRTPDEIRSGQVTSRPNDPITGQGADQGLDKLKQLALTRADLVN